MAKLTFELDIGDIANASENDLATRAWEIVQVTTERLKPLFGAEALRDALISAYLNLALETLSEEEVVGVLRKLLGNIPKAAILKKTAASMNRLANVEPVGRG